MTKIEKNLFKILSQSRGNNKSNIHYFEITSLSFKMRTKIGVCTLAKTHVIFQLCLLYMLGFIHSFMTGNFNPKLPWKFEAKVI